MARDSADLRCRPGDLVEGAIEPRSGRLEEDFHSAKRAPELKKHGNDHSYQHGEESHRDGVDDQHVHLISRWGGVSWRPARLASKIGGALQKGCRVTMIPLVDASRRPVRVPVVTIFIVLVNIFVFFLELSGGDAFVTRWSLVPADVIAGRNWIAILTAMFMHGSWSHIVGNMVFLWAFGPEIEDVMGRARYLVFYLAGGLVASLAQIVAQPHSTVPNLGASGAIAAVMGAFLVTYPRDRIKTVLWFFLFVRVRLIPAALLIGIWFLTQLVNMGAVANVQTGGVAYLAHVGGFVFGAAVAQRFESPRQVAARSLLM